MIARRPLPLMFAWALLGLVGCSADGPGLLADAVPRQALKARMTDEEIWAISPDGARVFLRQPRALRHQWPVAWQLDAVRVDVGARETLVPWAVTLVEGVADGAALPPIFALDGDKVLHVFHGGGRITNVDGVRGLLARVPGGNEVIVERLEPDGRARLWAGPPEALVAIEPAGSFANLGFLEGDFFVQVLEGSGFSATIARLDLAARRLVPVAHDTELGIFERLCWGARAAGSEWAGPPCGVVFRRNIPGVGSRIVFRYENDLPERVFMDGDPTTLDSGMRWGAPFLFWTEGDSGSAGSRFVVWEPRAEIRATCGLPTPTFRIRHLSAGDAVAVFSGSYGPWPGYRPATPQPLKPDEGIFVWSPTSGCRCLGDGNPGRVVSRPDGQLAWQVEDVVWLAARDEPKPRRLLETPFWRLWDHQGSVLLLTSPTTPYGNLAALNPKDLRPAPVPIAEKVFWPMSWLTESTVLASPTAETRHAVLLDRWNPQEQNGTLALLDMHTRRRQVLATSVTAFRARVAQPAPGINRATLLVAYFVAGRFPSDRDGLWLLRAPWPP